MNKWTQKTIIVTTGDIRKMALEFGVTTAVDTIDGQQSQQLTLFCLQQELLHCPLLGSPFQELCGDAAAFYGTVSTTGHVGHVVVRQYMSCPRQSGSQFTQGRFTLQDTDTFNNDFINSFKNV